MADKGFNLFDKCALECVHLSHQEEVLKAKQQKGIQLPFIFLKFYMNQYSNQFLLFFHFPGL